MLYDRPIFFFELYVSLNVYRNTSGLDPNAFIPNARVPLCPLRVP